MSACAACGGELRRWRRATASDPRLAGSAGYELWRCVECGTARTDVPGEPPPLSLYEAGTYAPARPTASRLLEPLRRLAERDKLRFVRGLPAGARILEVGAGNGSFVVELRAAGYDATGIEPSERAVVLSGARGVPVERAALEDVTLEESELDAAVLWHVLEHLEDPVAALDRIRPWLRPGGRVVIACPNLASLQAAIGGDRWFHQDVPRHRTHFTAAGLRRLLERGGFEVERMSQVLVEQNPLGMWQTILNRLTRGRDVAFRALKRDLGSERGVHRDLLLTGVAGPLLAPIAVALELAAGIAGHGGSVVAVATRGGDPRTARSLVSASVIIPTAVGGSRLERLLESLGDASASVDVIVVDNASGDPEVAGAAQRHDGVEVIALDRNVGYSRAVNLAARRARGDALVLLNDDCVCDPGYAQEITSALDPSRGVTMAAGVMREALDPERIDTAGMQLDETLLVFDYLNGEPLDALDGAADPIGPSGAAAAFDREAFLACGGFDERLFAYWEDVDLVLRMRAAGGRCALARGARGVHEHSATLGSGSRAKNRLMGFGRGYVLRKWSVLADPRRLARALATDGVVCLGQVVVDRSLAGIGGRLSGYRAATAEHPYPDWLLDEQPGREGALRTLRRRVQRRARLRSGATPIAPPSRRPRFLAVFHAHERTGPLLSLQAELGWLASIGTLRVAAPGRGAVTDAFHDVAPVDELDYAPLMLPRDPLGVPRAIATTMRESKRFAALLREARPDLVVVVSTLLPAAVIAARREGVPVLLYAAEIHRGPEITSRLRRLAGSGLMALAGRAAIGVVACSEAVASGFPAALRSRTTVVYPPIGSQYADGDGDRFRGDHGIPGDARCILVVGNVTRGRGQDLLLQALPWVRSRIRGTRLVLAGPTFDRPKDLAYEAELRGIAVELGIAAELTFAGAVPNIADAYAAADVVVNPARTPESFGRVACEALVAGCPVVATRVGAAEEVLAGLPGVELVPPDQPAPLATALVAALTDPTASARAREGGDRVAQRYSPQRSLEAFQGAVDRAMGDHARSCPASSRRRPSAA